MRSSLMRNADAMINSMLVSSVCLDSCDNSHSKNLVRFEVSNAYLLPSVVIELTMELTSNDIDNSTMLQANTALSHDSIGYFLHAVTQLR